MGSVSVDFEVAEGHVSILLVGTYERTGVEMEALTACSVAALTIYDMCKSIDKGMVISDLALLEKPAENLARMSELKRIRPIHCIEPTVS